MRTMYIPVKTYYNIVTKKKELTIMTISRMTFDIDKELKTELQIIALRQDRAVKDILNDLIQEFVNENK